MKQMSIHAQFLMRLGYTPCGEEEAKSLVTVLRQRKFAAYAFVGDHTYITDETGTNWRVEGNMLMNRFAGFIKFVDLLNEEAITLWTRPSL